MIAFVNAKINIGLQIVNRRADGYHDLQTIFYPVGVLAGTPNNPVQFCDILEVNSNYRGELIVNFTGRTIDCPPEKNLVCRAANLFLDRARQNGLSADVGFTITLEKHLPDGAGMGGGSADAGFVLRMLNDCATQVDSSFKSLSNQELCRMALSLGADCPFFIINSPVYAEGVGEEMQHIDLSLKDHWLLVVKPSVYISTREAFAGVAPKPADFDLRTISSLPIYEWRQQVHNDFEDSIFPNHPEMRLIKEQLYETGAEYASLTGSGSCIYGIFDSEECAIEALRVFENVATIEGVSLLKL